MRTIRCSSLPRLAVCAAAGEPPATWVEPLRDGSDLGSAFHEAMAIKIKGGEAPHLPDIAARWDVDPDELIPMVLWAWGQWNTLLAPMFPEPLVEEPMSIEDVEVGLTLTGSADVLALVDDEIRGLDYKSGYLKTDATDQQRGYAMQGFCRWPEAKRARMTVMRLRDRYLETFVTTREEIMAWWGGLAKHLSRADHYRPGEHCGFCPRALECPAHREALRSTATMLETISTDALDADQLGEAVLQAKVLEKRVEQFLEQAKAAVVARGGEWGPLRVVATDRRTIDFPRCHELLVETLGRDALLPILKVGKSDVEKVVMKQAPPRMGGKNVRFLMEQLEGLHAFKVSTSHKLEVTSHGSAINPSPDDNSIAGNEPG